MPYEGLSLDSDALTSAKTAAYQVLPADCGKIFTNRGASGAVTFTLPAVADVSSGWQARFFVVADQSITVAAPSGKLIAFNNATRTSIAFSTTSEKIGGGVWIVFDGTSYLAFLQLGLETQTPAWA